MCMKKTLAEIFKNKCVTGTIPDDAFNYFWYLDETNALIGISKTISQTERELIELNYINIDIKALNDVVKLKWLSFLKGETTSFSAKITDNPKISQVKFIYFNHDFNAFFQHEFEALVHSFFHDSLVFFLDSDYGVILDTTCNSSRDELHDFLLATTHDFSSELIFYESINYELNSQLPHKFRTELELFKSLKGQSSSVLTCDDLFLNYLISSEVIGTHPIFGDWFKDILYVDAELLAVVKCYLECGFNVTTGAKLMHMHRNTFMNKLDRFIELTHLDVKQTRQAFIAYLLMRLRKDV